MASSDNPLETLNRESSAEEIRECLGALLEKQYMMISNAYDLVCPWKYGNGYDFYDCDRRDFQDIFGTEVGIMLYRHWANECRRRQYLERREAEARRENGRNNARHVLTC